MKKKSKSPLGILYFLYISLFIVLIYKSAELGLMGSKIKEVFVNIRFTSSIGVSSSIFFIIFYSMIYFMFKSEVDEIIAYEDDNIKNKIRNKLIPYKLLILLSIVLGLCATFISKNNDIFFISIYLLVNSVLIHYSKYGELKSDMYKRPFNMYKDFDTKDQYTCEHRGNNKLILFISIAVVIFSVVKASIGDTNKYDDIDYIENENNEEYSDISYDKSKNNESNNEDIEYRYLSTQEEIDEYVGNLLYETGYASYEDYYFDLRGFVSKEDMLRTYEDIEKSNLEYKIIDSEGYYVESTFNTFEDYDGMVDRQIVGDKKYGQILYKYSYDRFYDGISFPKETALSLIELVLPEDAVEERVLVNKGYGLECRVYSSSQGTFVVRMSKAQYFNGTEPYYDEDDIVSLKYFKLM